MTKLYNMDQHSRACKMKFTTTYTYGLDKNPHSIVHTTGISETFQSLSWKSDLTLDKMFELFIDNNSKSYTIMYLYDNGDLMHTIRITVEDNT
ncbi:hypothetical protein [Vibrio phage JSF13]|uniref:Uncharacterized protein ORF63 n=1 Tax=Vibrio phage ICP1 TaxID=979525 RepID=F1D185_9CAUD|nr:hypothetical protein ViPhICP1_gp063 [Vibrio phage ICP1]ADX88106.1 hypothetical protein TUST1-191_00300 [Vibrio phage ICP1_2006_D]ADX88333.1 hypothetical protein TUST1-182_00300 [Vibrio phage ICP1_2006_C]ADX88560.1 hypothetical protein TUST1-159_00300 [Vibrio phage ICP1_2006_B]ADX88786.1 hypothetical protein TUST1-17_00300 [Vibrio phage ICP1_2006_A]ADX89012.1 hypothetical protein TUST1-15_00300 [Vibrio phage ICP1_2005_A]ADX89244.1 hypothetical protein TUST1-2_00310 [Vibrio phage ICP1_2001_A